VRRWQKNPELGCGDPSSLNPLFYLALRDWRTSPVKPLFMCHFPDLSTSGCGLAIWEPQNIVLKAKAGYGIFGG
jgi:hypothetical protein